jgi:FkbM family methyltransferase
MTNPAHPAVADLPGFNKLVKARHGHFVVNENDAYVGRSLLTYGEYSEEEVRLFARLCAAGDAVVEAGANIGAHTVPLARLVGETGRVVAFEPQPVVFQTLCANLALNSLVNVAAQPLALGAGRARVRYPPIDYAAKGNYGGLPLLNVESGTPVEVAPLDEVFEGDRLNLLKIDVEGMESQVLAGALRTIARFRPILYVENDRLEASEKLIRQIQSYGYRLWWHISPMFEAENCFGRAENVFPGIASCNMVGVHRRQDLAFDDLTEITDPTVHPARR